MDQKLSRKLINDLHDERYCTVSTSDDDDAAGRRDSARGGRAHCRCVRDRLRLTQTPYGLIDVIPLDHIVVNGHRCRRRRCDASAVFANLTQKGADGAFAHVGATTNGAPLRGISRGVEQWSRRVRFAVIVVDVL